MLGFCVQARKRTYWKMTATEKSENSQNVDRNKTIIFL